MPVDPHAGPQEFVRELERTDRTPPSAGGSDDLTGKVVAGRYRVLDTIGQGGMGSVYRVEHIEIGKQCAIKVLHSVYGQDDQQRRRFLREARAASTIAHENVVDVTDFGPSPNGSVFLAMELLVGEELSTLLGREGALPWARVKPMVLQICEALGAAHDKGIFHRDVKPENCFRVKRGANHDFIKVLDFGIAKIMNAEVSADLSLSQTGAVFGTPQYMSPEQAMGNPVDHRTDIYAMGVVIYEMLAGKVPFDGPSHLEILTRQTTELPEPPRDVVPQIPEAVDAIVLRALQKRPDARFQSIGELAAALAAVPTDGAATANEIPTPRTRPSLDHTRERLYIAIIVLLGLSVLAMGGVLATLALRG